MFFFRQKSPRCSPGDGDIAIILIILVATISTLGLGVGMPQPAYYSTFDSAVFCYILNITVRGGRAHQ
jgi:hypothetical protein